MCFSISSLKNVYSFGKNLLSPSREYPQARKISLYVSSILAATISYRLAPLSSPFITFCIYRAHRFYIDRSIKRAFFNSILRARDSFIKEEDVLNIKKDTLSLKSNYFQFIKTFRIEKNEFLIKNLEKLEEIQNLNFFQTDEGKDLIHQIGNDLKEILTPLFKKERPAH